MNSVLSVAMGVGMTIGLAIHFIRQNRFATLMTSKIRTELAAHESLALPDLVTRLGLNDGFINRGKLMTALNPLVASGEIIQEEPAGTTVKNRLSVLTFRLNRQQRQSSSV